MSELPRGEDRPVRVLLADDQAMLHERRVRSRLDSARFNVEFTERGVFALRKADQVDVLVLDLDFGDQAWEITEEIDPRAREVYHGSEMGYRILCWYRAKRPDVPVIIMTGERSSGMTVRCLAEGALAYVDKDAPEGLDYDVLVSWIHAAADQRRAQHGDVAGTRQEETGQFVSTDPIVRETVIKRAAIVAKTDATVLLLGESGVGKEHIARLIHSVSPRAGKPFVPVNMGAIPQSLMESELFGHEKGSFTGAVGTARGLFEQAHGGTIFLDEIAEASPEVQTALLRVLEQRTVRRVGSQQSELPIDLRLIAATNRPLMQFVADGRFREDLYHRLNVVPIRIPPLRERPGDVLLLAEYFLSLFGARKGLRYELCPDARAALVRQSWHGNVRELRNVIERAVLLARRPALQAHDLHFEPSHTAQWQSIARELALRLHEGDAYVLTFLDYAHAFVFQQLLELCGQKNRAGELLGWSAGATYTQINRWTGQFAAAVERGDLPPDMIPEFLREKVSLFRQSPPPSE
jgi:DNA-binding NtrC family response regulator